MTTNQRKKRPTETSRTTLRADVRHLAWRSVAVAAVEAKLEGPPDWVSTDAGLRRLYWATRADVVAYLRARARGELLSPPGGVGGGRTT